MSGAAWVPALWVLSACGATGGPAAGGLLGRSTAEAAWGVRSLPESTWGEVRHQPAWAIGVVTPVEQGPLALEVSGSYSSDEHGGDYATSDVRGCLYDLGAGLRLSLASSDSPLVPYVSYGYSAVYARLEDIEGEQVLDDLTYAPYFRVGLRFAIGDTQNCAIEWRVVDPLEVQLWGQHDHADFQQLMFVLSESW